MFPNAVWLVAISDGGISSDALGSGTGGEISDSPPGCGGGDCLASETTTFFGGDWIVAEMDGRSKDVDDDGEADPGISCTFSAPTIDSNDDGGTKTSICNFTKPLESTSLFFAGSIDLSTWCATRGCIFEDLLFGSFGRTEVGVLGEDENLTLSESDLIEAFP